ncbi:MAG TPA: hemolysin family protein [Woeseiaceae bacterium]|nr:hemolysin family protein [Woeseiaceae bacterium]
MSSVGISLVAVVALLAANAFFVAAEFALVKAKGFRLEMEADAGSGTARMTVSILARLESYLAACQLGITMASLGLGWIGEPAVAALLTPLLHPLGLSDALIHKIAFLTGFLIFSSLHIVIGEQVPKSFAIRQPERVSKMTAYPLQLFYWFAFPLTWLLDRASRGTLRLFGVDESTHGEALTLQELKGVLATSRAHGKISRTRARMMKNLIELDERPVGWVMIPQHEVTVLNASLSMEENRRRIAETRHSRFPLIDGEDKVLGIVLQKDLFQAEIDGTSDPMTKLDVFCRRPVFVPERQTVSKTFETLRADSVHMAIVVDEYGEIAGIVTLEDLLEEIVGEIRDEKDKSEASYNVSQLSDASWSVDGGISISDAAREFGLVIESGSLSNTLAGLFMERLERIPEVGDTLETDGFRLTVEETSGRHATRISVRRLPIDV